MATKPNKKIELLDDPVVLAVLKQQIPGVYVEEDDDSPGIKRIEKFAKEATDELGLLFYGSEDKNVSVLFNPVVISAEEVQAADEQGKLTELFPKYAQISGEEEEEGAPPEETTPQANLGTLPRRAAAPADKLAAMTPPSPPGASNLISALQAPAI